jgi:hypothetical protein
LLNPLHVQVETKRRALEQNDWCHYNEAWAQSAPGIRKADFMDFQRFSFDRLTLRL